MFSRFVSYTILSVLLFTSCQNTSKNVSSRKNIIDTSDNGLIVKIHDPVANYIIDTNASFEILAKGFYWSEGPLWVDEIQSLIFSDVPANVVYKWNAKDSISIFLESAGHSGIGNKKSGRGSNGLILNHENRLLLCQHGDRRIAMMDADLKNPRNQFYTIADNYNGKRLNSPNDLVIDDSGNIYFTDPPYGMPDNKTGEIGINGVYKISHDKAVSLLVDSLTKPNGIGISNDQQTLYINQSDHDNPVLYSYDITKEGKLENGKILFNFSDIAKTYKGLPDGLKVHKSGNIFATGPGGVHIISPTGKLLATIKTEKSTSNCAFDTDQKYLYTTTTDLLMRIALK